MLSVEAAGPGTTIQDAGRLGLQRFGVTPAGPMDAMAFRTANLALGNEPDAAAIEIATGGIALSVDRPTSLAFAGGGFAWTRDGAALPSAAVVALRPGERLRARAGRWGAFCYCAVPGGIATASVLGSRSTHRRSGLGHVVVAGDRFVVEDGDRRLDDAHIAAPWLGQRRAPIRVVLGPQDDHFTAAGLKALTDGPYTLTHQADRMAYRFAGAEIDHAGDYNIVSDGVATGAIQVAGDRAPMVLMADRQTTGGYPKIAHVARVDIGRLAQMRPGESCRFVAVSASDARDRLLLADRALDDTRRHLRAVQTTPSAVRLSTENLIGGIVDGSMRGPTAGREP